MPSTANDNFDINILKSKVLLYAHNHHGKIYAPIMHPEFENIPSYYGHESFKIVEKFIPNTAKTVLDIGAHWGYWCHRLENLGLNVTAVENNKTYLYFLEQIKYLCKKRFTILPISIFDLENLNYDIILCFNIFHHFLKTEVLFKSFISLLKKMKTDIIFFQAHDFNENQMSNAFKNFLPDQFAEFIKLQTSMSKITYLGSVSKRNIYMIER